MDEKKRPAVPLEFDHLEPLDDLEPIEDPTGQEARAPAGNPAPGARPASVERGKASGSPASPVSSRGTGGTGGTGPAGPTLGQKRQLEQAPLQLRKASKILFVAGLLPMAGVRVTEFSGGQFPWMHTYAAKAIALVAMWLFYQGYVATHQGQSKIAALDKFAKAHHLVMPIVATVISLFAVWFLFQAPAFENASIWAEASSFVEVGTLLLASVTFSHIFGYEHGGKFNPIFPLMFLGPGLGGVFALFIGFQNLSASTGDAKLAAAGGLLGQIVAAVGGLMAMWIMYKAMKEAKAEGDRKRDEAREARKAARGAAKSTGAAPRATRPPLGRG